MRWKVSNKMACTCIGSTAQCEQCYIARNYSTLDFANEPTINNAKLVGTFDIQTCEFDFALTSHECDELSDDMLLAEMADNDRASNESEVTVYCSICASTENVREYAYKYAHTFKPHMANMCIVCATYNALPLNKVDAVTLNNAIALESKNGFDAFVNEDLAWCTTCLREIDYSDNEIYSDESMVHVTYDSEWNIATLECLNCRAISINN